MKPVTQMLRAFIETDPPKAKGSGPNRSRGPLAVDFRRDLTRDFH